MAKMKSKNKQNNKSLRSCSEGSSKCIGGSNDNIGTTFVCNNGQWVNIGLPCSGDE
ncbi:hypothetical protein [Paenibacillus polymyxa]|uniref:hypothetical protein n=1 Tax=Paenibacillus polymyxa TaxID=1406 RepID=UPI0012DB47BC|nr:hypothetical protein [Paenibacillus polymyxa]